MSRSKLLTACRFMAVFAISSLMGCSVDPQGAGAGAGEDGPTAVTATVDLRGETPAIDIKGAPSMDLVRISSGSFMMGTESTDSIWLEPSRPVHQVTIRRDFYIGQYEVTQAQWSAVMGSNPSEFGNCDDCPVEQVSWEDAVEFCDILSSITGHDIRLPTEAEWEYACRAGTTTEYSFGDSAADLDDYAWNGGNSGWRTHEVGTKLANPWGLYDMHGNVWEMCEDTWHVDYAGAPSDGSAWTIGGVSSKRVHRGGSWLNTTNARSAYRAKDGTDRHFSFFGFRVALGT